MITAHSLPRCGVFLKALSSFLLWLMSVLKFMFYWLQLNASFKPTSLNFMNSHFSSFISTLQQLNFPPNSIFPVISYKIWLINKARGTHLCKFCNNSVKISAYYNIYVIYNEDNKLTAVVLSTAPLMSSFWN